MAKKKNFIKGAIKHPGAFTKWCKSHGFGSVTQACIAAGRRSKNTRVMREANLAATLRKLPRKKKR